MSMKKSWRDRLASYPHLPNVKEIPPPMRKRHGEGTIATPSPREVEEAMRGVPEGRLATVLGIGEDIAVRHRATIGCTVTTAIFAHMVAHATEEAQERTPYWRTLKIGGELNPKYPGGIEAQMARLEAEGHTVVQRGKRYFVEDFAKKLSGTR
ncbi:6-O-methylguanine DNA methyltransferase [Variovorax boronicumulans]|uniref:6-O-methylguanine DNA methyltransferase n=1 Tax=Variovorax boronicumulans TaxID=436515 RepID=UPI002781294F|nr:6-O-methylguanine DNA methyltransferase [Variovorax boronicumulans]MDQ0039901.1 alkylated DNA nucleotide flippase Atl1 [Variovorax boronicumulans]